MKSVRIGIVGTGGMANGHAGQFRRMPRVKLTACCDIDRQRAEEFAARHEIPHVFTSPLALFDSGLVDGISNVTPDTVHADVAIAAAHAGLHILSEKPLAMNVEEGRAMVRAVRKAGVVNLVNFSFRDSSALQECARRIAAGDIGRVMHVEGSYLQAWLPSKVWGDWRTRTAFLWRLSTQHGSMGTLGDIGCHLLDGVAFVGGDIAEISCRLENFHKGVPRNRMGEYRLDANDSFSATLLFRDGGLGVAHATRWATGQTNSLALRIYGDVGGIRIDRDRSMDHYEICVGKDVDTSTWRTVKARPAPNTYRRFVNAIRNGTQEASDFVNGLKVQAYLEACMASHETGGFVKVRLPRR